MGNNEKPMTRAIATTKRQCLGLNCRRWFASTGKGNRLCPKCDKRNSTVSQPARCEFLGRSQSEDSIARQVKLTNGSTGVE